MTPIFYFILLKCLMKIICCLIFHLKLPFPLLKNRQFVFPPITYCFRVKILKSIWSSNFQSSFRIIYWFIFWQCTPKQILIKVLTAMIIMPPYRNILLYGIESFICSLCLNNEIIIEIKLILLLKKNEENKCHYNKHMNLQPSPKQLKTIYMWLC